MKTFVFVIFSVLLLFVGLAACGGGRDAERRLDRADAIMDSIPDSALTVLDSIHADRLKGGQRARYGLLYTKAATKNRTPLADDSLIGMAVDYYAGRGDSLEIQSLYYQGEVYSYAGVLDTALVSLHNAYDKAVAADDSFYAAMSAREISSIYGRLQISGNELDWAKTAKETFDNTGCSEHSKWMDLMIIRGMEHAGNLVDALDLINHVDSGLFHENKTFRRRVLISKADILTRLHRYSDVINEYHSLTADGYVLTAYDHLKLADIYTTTDSFEVAEMQINEAMKLPMTAKDSMYSDYLQAMVLIAHDNYKDANKLLRSLAVKLVKNEEINLANPKTLLLTDNYRLQAENQYLKSRQSKLLNYWLTGLCIVLVIMLSCAYMWYRARTQLLMAENEKFFAEAQTLRDDWEFSRIKIKQASDEREDGFKKEITDLFARHKQVLDNLCTVWFRASDHDLTNKVQREVFASIKKLQDPDIVENLTNIIDKYDNNWMSKFKETYRDLSSSDYMLTMYLYLGFQPETIAVLMNKKTTKAVYTAKYKLMQKLMLHEDADCLALTEKLHF